MRSFLRTMGSHEKKRAKKRKLLRREIFREMENFERKENKFESARKISWNA